MRIAITGSTGLVGTALVKELEGSGHEVLRLVREEVRDPQREVYWKPSEGQLDASRLEGVDAVVHLAGASVAQRWTPEVKQAIRQSRVESTRLLAGAVARLPQKPRVFCCASAVGFYGDRGETILDEEAPAGSGFLAQVCQEWEAAAQPAWEAGIRVAQMRFGMVLSTEGGALKKMLTPFRLGAGGIIASGNQFMSWITRDNVIKAICFTLNDDALHGAVNTVTPQPVTNREFTKTLGSVLGRPTVVPMPAFAARLAFGEMADELLIASARVVPRRLQEAGFQFAHPQLEGALRSLLEQEGGTP